MDERGNFDIHAEEVWEILLNSEMDAVELEKSDNERRSQVEPEGGVSDKNRFDSEFGDDEDLMDAVCQIEKNNPKLFSTGTCIEQDIICSNSNNSGDLASADNNITSDTSHRPNRRFPVVDEEEMTAIEEGAASEGTKKQTKWGVKLYREWLLENGKTSEFEEFSKIELDETLRGFYSSARTGDGKPYSKSTYVGLRAAINRHLRSNPYLKQFSIIDDPSFHKSNSMFNAMLKKLKREGYDQTKHHSAISESDLNKLRSSGVLSIDSPKSLLRKVWFDISLNFARRGRENMRELTPSAFVFKTDSVGKAFVEMSYNEATKNHAGDNIKDRDFESKPRMYATGRVDCPVESLKLFLSKRNSTNEIFFQQPKLKFAHLDETWYTTRPVGPRMLNDMMKDISKAAELSEIYTNHCVRATAITVLSHAGVEAREIMRISGHRNEQSIRSYNTDSSEEQKQLYSSILSGSGNNRSFPSSACCDNRSVINNASPSFVAPTTCAPATMTTMRFPLRELNHPSGSFCNSYNSPNNIPQAITFQKQFEMNNCSVTINNYYCQPNKSF